MERHIKHLISVLIIGCLVFEGEPARYNVDISSYDPNDISTHTFFQNIFLSDQDDDEVIVSSSSMKYSGFYILQVHSQRLNISLTHSEDIKKHANGYNIGILQFFQETFSDTFLLQSRIQNDTLLLEEVLIAVTIYNDKAPIPGGCETNQRKTPMLNVFNGPSIITVKAEAPSSNDHSCNDSMHDVMIEVYHKYLPSQVFSKSQYFDGLSGMLSVEGIKSNGSLVAILEGYTNLEKFFSSYIGTGEVFAVLVYKNSMVSAYVPAVSYGGDINYLIEKDEKGTSGQDVFIVLFSTLPFVALVIIYRGHAFFHFTTFSLGLSCGTILSFFFLSKEGATTIDHTFFISLMIGLLYGSIWLGIWYKFGVPLLSATLTFLHAGALFTSIIYHFGLADDENFHINAIYWTIFFGIVFMCWFSLSMFTMHGHILSCSFLGSYILMITTLNFWVGGNLQYIMINVYRRMFVSGFNVAILKPPFQTSDHIISLVGLLFILHGFSKQLKNQRGKPPFPPHNTFRMDAERSPLLGNF
ncbi:transmembrane 7 superfamily member 3-like [Harmonia axyridis]|uniref:transmembrane 7 superfamily member 3-like n=1 Tax=Harmonia axyridis TaxID=115357 RepID=UPI001E279A7E|nr:transmembrane 7 superfamily member 3-like [Harmonia axyridis]